MSTVVLVNEYEMNAAAYAFLSWQRPAVLLINEYECVDPVYPLHIPTNNFPTVAYLSIN